MSVFLFIITLALIVITVFEIKEIDKCDKELEELQATKESLLRQRETLKENNKILRYEYEELKSTLTRLQSLATSNNYGNEKARLDKIKELISA